MQFDVETGAIRDHSKDVFDYATRLRSARSAALTTLGQDAFGPMLSFFATSPPEVAASTKDSIGDRAAEMEDAVDGLRQQAATHDTNDQGAVDNVRRTLR